MAFLDSIKEEIRSSTLDRAKNSYHDGEEVTDFTLLGNDPGRGRRPVEWGEILFVHPFVCPSPKKTEPDPGRPKQGPGRP